MACRRGLLPYGSLYFLLLIIFMPFLCNNNAAIPKLCNAHTLTGTNAAWYQPPAPKFFFKKSSCPHKYTTCSNSSFELNPRGKIFPPCKKGDSFALALPFGRNERLHSVICPRLMCEATPSTRYPPPVFGNSQPLTRCRLPLAVLSCTPR